MSSLKQNLIQQKEKAEKKELEKIKQKKDLETFSFFPITIVIYAIAVIILWRNQKITWHENKLLLDEWAYISLSVITVLVALTFTAGLLGATNTWRGLFFKSVDEIELLVKEIQKTNPEILERLEKEEKEK